MAHVEVKWIFSHDVNRAEYYSTTYNIPNYTSNYDDILSDTEVEIVDVCNLPNRHIAFAEKALENKKGVIIEKPIGIDLEKALRFYEKYKDSDIPVLVVYQYPYSETFSKLKEIYLSEEYGKLKGYRVKYFSQRDDAYYRKWTAHGDEAGGGVLINQGIHFINLIYSFLGYSNMKLCATVGNIAHKLEVEDTILLQTFHENGIIGSFFFSSGLPSEMCVELFLEDALVWTKGGEVVVQNKKKQVLLTPQKGDYKMLVEEYLLNVEKYSGCKMNFKEAIHDLNIVISSYVSAKENKIVEVKFIK